MSSDGRYMYNSPSQQAMATSYEYPAYATSAYDNAQISQQHPHHSQQQHQQQQPSVRSNSNMRVNSPPSHQQQTPQTHYYPPPPPPTQQQQQQYPPPSYPTPAHTHPHGMPPTGPGQWPSENWGHYSTSYGPPPIPEASPFNSGPGRPEPTSMPPAPQPQLAPPPPQSQPVGQQQQRNNYIPAAPRAPSPEERRTEERYTPSVPSPVPAPAPKPRRREKDQPVPISSSSPPPVLDFAKLFESYQMMMDVSGSIVHTTLSPPADGRMPPAETMERMLQAATYGSQMLENAIIQQQQQQQQQQQPNTPETRPSAQAHAQIEVEEPAESSTSHTVSLSPKKDAEDTAQEGQTCLGCNATSTPEWRRGPLGPRTLCNACGLVYAKLIKKRARESNRTKTPKTAQANVNAGANPDDSSDDSEDAHSFAGRSEVGDQVRRE